MNYDIWTEKEIDTITKNSPIAICKIDKNFKFVWANKAFEDYFGYTSEEIKNYTFSDIAVVKDRKWDEEMARKVIQGERATYNAFKSYIHKRGHRIDADLFVAGVYDIVDGKFVFSHFISIIQPVEFNMEQFPHEKREQAFELIKKDKKLNKLERIKKSFWNDPVKYILVLITSISLLISAAYNGFKKYEEMQMEKFIKIIKQIKEEEEELNLSNQSNKNDKAE